MSRNTRHRLARRLGAALVLIGSMSNVATVSADDGAGGVGGTGGSNAYQTTTANGSGDPAGTVSADGSWGFVEAGGNLGDVDLLTGRLLDGDVRENAGSDALVVADLYDDGQLAIDAQRIAEQARLESERRRAQQEAARKAAAAKTTLAGVPTVLMAAINMAVQAAKTERPDCQIDASFLAAVAKNESGSWWSRLQSDGQMTPPLRSPDGAKGPFQFMDPAWSSYGGDGNGDGVADPDNAYDAAIGSMRMHCAIAAQLGNEDLTDPANAQSAFYLYCAGQGADPAGKNGSGACATSSRRRRDDAAAYRDQAESIGMTDAQTSVGPDGCPTSAPPGTLRDGSASIGVGQLCRDSVALAATPQAAAAIKEALRQLGDPYSLEKRNNPGFRDCSSLVSRAYNDSGTPIIAKGTNAPSTYNLLPHDGGQRLPWSVPITQDAARPGDLVFPHEHHVTMLLAHNFVIQAPAPGDVVDVIAMYKNPLAFRRVDPSKI